MLIYVIWKKKTSIGYQYELGKESSVIHNFRRIRQLSKYNSFLTAGLLRALGILICKIISKRRIHYFPKLLYRSFEDSLLKEIKFEKQWYRWEGDLSLKRHKASSLIYSTVKRKKKWFETGQKENREKKMVNGVLKPAHTVLWDSKVKFSGILRASF